MPLPDLFAQLFGNEPATVKPEQQARLAAAVVLVEIGTADMQLDGDEAQVIRHALAEHFAIAENDAQALLEQARHERDVATSMQPWIATLNQSLDRVARRDLLESLWRVAFADGELHVHEEQLMRRIAELLFLSHADFIQTKMAVTGEE